MLESGYTCMQRKSISRQALERLTTYLNYLHGLPDDSKETISATNIADALGINQVVVRKDLAEVSSGGRPKVGYVRHDLIRDIEHSLGWDDVCSAVLVGVGNLGRALLSYKGFDQYGLEIVVAFDSSRALQGHTFGRTKVLSPVRMADLCRRMRLHIGIITVPAEEAQAVCDTLVDCGIRAIWNFAPTHLCVPDHVIVKNENMAASLCELSHGLAAQDNTD